MTLWKWSRTANSNATADSSINYAEGQSPGSLNNSGRGVMAAMAKFRDDISGIIVTGGSSTAYTVTTYQVLTSLTDGFQIAFQPHTDCGAAPTLEIDSLGDLPLRPYSGTDFAAGQLKSSGIYRATYRAADEEWIVSGFFANILADYPDLVAIEALSGTSGVARKTAANTWALDDGTTDLLFAKDNSGTVFSTGIAGDIHVPFACTITGAYLYADQTGSIVIDVWKDTHANFPPTDSDSITASAPPTISSGTKASDTTLTGWTTSITAGDILRFNIDSVSAITRFTLALKVKRFI